MMSGSLNKWSTHYSRYVSDDGASHAALLVNIAVSDRNEIELSVTPKYVMLAKVVSYVVFHGGTRLLTGA